MTSEESKAAASPLRPALYLIPSTMSDASVSDVIPERNLAVIRAIRHFVVENVRTVRRFLKRCDRSIDIDSLSFTVLDEHTAPTEVSAMLAPLRAGEPVGVISEAGCPAVADPGADLVGIAQAEGLEVVPLVGPSSILLSLMGSGFNGQTFAFRGYLPYEQPAPARHGATHPPGGRDPNFHRDPLSQQPPHRRACLIATSVHETLRGL